MISAKVAQAMALRDQLAAILRDSSIPLSAAQLAVLADTPGVEFGFQGRCDFLHANAKHYGWEIVVCRGNWEHQFVDQPAAVTYRQLEVMEKLGTVARVPRPDSAGIHQVVDVVALHYRGANSETGCVYWRYVANAVDEAFTSLISSLEDR